MEEKRNERGNKSMLKKVWGFLHSMKLAIAILIVLAVVCTLGSLVPQGELESYYINSYPEWLAKLILNTQFDRVFQCWWFIALAGFLCVNLLLCSILRFGKVRRRFRSEFSVQNRVSRRDAGFTAVSDRELPEDFFKQMGFAARSMAVIDGTEYTYAVRNRAGVWGSWLCHLGMLVIIIGFAVGQALSLETSVYGVPGMEKEIPGTDYRLRIDDFDIDLREDETVEQYTAHLTVTDTSGEDSVSGIAQVNAPMDAFGMRVYQNSTGWACNLKIYKNGVLQKEQILCAGETISPDDFPELVLVFTRFYPDYYYDQTSGPMTLSSSLKNPHAIFSLYYQGEIVAMDAIEIGYNIDVDDYRFVFEEPQQYTLIQIIRDPTMHFVAFGGLLTLFSLILAFYVRTEELWSYRDEGGRMVVCIRSRKGAELMQERLSGCLEKAGVKVQESRKRRDAAEAAKGASAGAMGEKPVVEKTGARMGAADSVSEGNDGADCTAENTGDQER